MESRVPRDGFCLWSTEGTPAPVDANNAKGPQGKKILRGCPQRRSGFPSQHFCLPLPAGLNGSTYNFCYLLYTGRRAAALPETEECSADPISGSAAFYSPVIKSRRVKIQLSATLLLCHSGGRKCKQFPLTSNSSPASGRGEPILQYRVHLSSWGMAARTSCAPYQNDQPLTSNSSPALGRGEPIIQNS